MEDKIYRLSERMSSFCRAGMGRKTTIPIRSSEMGVLIYVALHAGTAGVRSVDLARCFGMRKASVSAIVASLERLGYLLRVTDREDRRSSPLFASETGKRLVDEAYEEYLSTARRLAEVLGLQRTEEFIQSLETATKLMQNGVGNQ